MTPTVGLDNYANIGTIYSKGKYLGLIDLGGYIKYYIWVMISLVTKHLLNTKGQIGD